jgi:hypothetical protein
MEDDRISFLVSLLASDNWGAVLDFVGKVEARNGLEKLFFDFTVWLRTPVALPTALKELSFISRVNTFPDSTQRRMFILLDQKGLLCSDLSSLLADLIQFWKEKKLVEEHKICTVCILESQSNCVPISSSFSKKRKFSDISNSHCIHFSDLTSRIASFSALSALIENARCRLKKEMAFFAASSSSSVDLKDIGVVETDINFVVSDIPSVYIPSFSQMKSEESRILRQFLLGAYHQAKRSGITQQYDQHFLDETFPRHSRTSPEFPPRFLPRDANDILPILLAEQALPDEWSYTEPHNYRTPAAQSSKTARFEKSTEGLDKPVTSLIKEGQSESTSLKTTSDQDEDLFPNWNETLENIRAHFAAKRNDSNHRSIPSLPQPILSSTDLFRRSCLFMKFTDLSEENYCSLCSFILQQELTLANASIFIEVSLYPRIISLSQPVSRLLYMTVSDILSRHPSAIVSSLLLPIMSSSSDYGVSQRELIVKLVQSLSKGDAANLLEQTILLYSQSGSPWTLTTVTGLKAALEKGDLEMSETVFDKLVSQIHHNFSSFANDVIFIGIISLLVSKFSVKLKNFIEMLISDLKTSKLFLSKMAIQNLLKLKEV